MGAESLNALAGARGGGGLLPVPLRRLPPGACPTPFQQSMLGNIARLAKEFLPALEEANEFPDGALQEVLRCRDLYDLGETTTVAPYDPSKLKVLRGGTVPRDAKSLVGSAARRFLEHADDLVVLDDAALVDLLPPTVPHWVPALARDLTARRAFVERLRQVGLVTYRRRARCHIGAFFVQKKADQIRLVLDPPAASKERAQHAWRSGAARHGRRVGRPVAPGGRLLRARLRAAALRPGRRFHRPSGWVSPIPGP